MAANNAPQQQQQQSPPPAGHSQPPASLSPPPHISPKSRRDGASISSARTSSAGNSISSRSMAAGSSRSHASATGRDDATAEHWKNVRVLPAWVQHHEEEETDQDDAIQRPPTAYRRPPTSSPHDAERERTPVTVGPTSPVSSRWKNYLEVSAYPPHTSHSEKVDADWLAGTQDLNGSWLAANRDVENEGGAGEEGEGLFTNSKLRKVWYKRFHIILLNNPVVPLTFRAFIWVLSLLALSLAGSIFHMSTAYGFSQKPSTVMAIVVDAVALVYLIYITYDEYSGKPLGLRSPKAKIRLIMFDLFFIIFNSANVALAFDTLYDVRWSCRSQSTREGFTEGSSVQITNANRVVDPICDRQRALTTFLFVALCAWVSTFMVSVFRVVERVSSR